MGKSKKMKSQKKKNEDFRKVKLKVGRKIKRANETLPEVRVGKIVIKNQFADPAAEGLVTKKKIQTYNLTEVRKRDESDNWVSEKVDLDKMRELQKLVLVTLKKCRNVKNTEKRDALIRIREILQNNPMQLLARTDTNIVEVVCPLFYDQDKEVRSEALKLFKLVMSGGYNKLSTCLSRPMIVPSLCRAMSQTYVDIQLNSLSVLDVLLDNCPYVVATGSEKLVSNLLCILQKQNQSNSTTKGTGSSGWTTEGRSFLVHPGSKLHKRESRLAVLERVNKIFRLLTCDRKDRLRVLRPPDYRPLYGEFPDDLFHPDDLLLPEEKGRCKTTASRALSLLMECWMETGFSRNPEEQQSMDQAGVVFLKLVLQTMATVLQFLKSIFDCEDLESDFQFVEWLNISHGKQFMSDFVRGFPFMIGEKEKKKGKWTGTEKDVSRSINVSICCLYSFFVPGCGQNDRAGQLQVVRQPDVPLDKITDYVAEALTLDSEILYKDDRFQLMLRKFLPLLLENKDLSQIFLRSCFEVVYHHLDPKSSRFHFWFKFVSDLIFYVGKLKSRPVEQNDWLSYSGFLRCVQQLPKLLLSSGKLDENTFLKLVETTRCAMNMKIEQLHENLTNKLEKLMDSSFLSELTEQKQVGVMDVVSQAEHIQQSDLAAFRKSVSNGTIKIAAFAQFLNILTSRYCDLAERNQHMSFCRPADIMNLILVAICGPFEPERAKQNSMPEDTNANLSIQIVYDFDCLEKLEKIWYRRKQFVEVACNSMMDFPLQDMVMKHFAGYVGRFLQKNKALPLLVCCSMLSAFTTLKRLPRCRKVPMETCESSLVELMIGLLHCIRMIDLTTRQIKKDSRSEHRRLALEILTEFLLMHHGTYHAMLDALEKNLMDGCIPETAQVYSDVLTLLLCNHEIEKISGSRTVQIKLIRTEHRRR